jgi:hypothetical protein
MGKKIWVREGTDGRLNRWGLDAVDGLHCANVKALRQPDSTRQQDLRRGENFHIRRTAGGLVRRTVCIPDRINCLFWAAHLLDPRVCSSPSSHPCSNRSFYFGFSPELGFLNLTFTQTPWNTKPNDAKRSLDKSW